MLVFALLIPLATAYQPSDEVLDQSSPLGGCVISNTNLAQSFRPKLPTLSKIEVGLYKNENLTGDFTISIQGRLNGGNLASKTLSYDEVSYYGGWVTIDFQDITVTRNKHYYIVFTGGEDRNIFWMMGAEANPYVRGGPWSLGGGIPFWIPLLFVVPYPDLSFRTYGYQ